MSLWNRYSRYLTREMVYVLVAALVVLTGLTVWHVTERRSLEREFIEQQRKIVVHDKRGEIETTLTTVYQNIRAISLLPSVRNIKGGNRVEAAKEDVVKSGRFSAEGNATVQAIYNNMAGQVNVSEIYAVVDGLDASKGEIPFFMFDTVKFGHQGSAEEEAPEKHDADTPEESEDAEYGYFPTQISALRSSHPQFNFEALDDIPAAASPLMRTCDNAQYGSISHGDVNNTNGFLYSVPFYNDKGDFRGVISAIIRSNVLEAKLLDVPLIPVTEDDRAAQAKAGWKLPEPSNFILGNAAHGIQILDRRHPELPELIKAGIPDRNVFRVPLNIHSDSPWELTYYLPETAIEAAVASHDSLFLVLLGVVLVALVAAAAALAALTRIRLQLGGEVTAVARVVEIVSNGALEADIPADVEEASVLGSMRRMLAKLRAIDEAASANAAQQAGMNREISELVGAAVEGDFTCRITLEGKDDYFRTLGEGLNRLMETNERSLNEFARVLTALAHGDLRESVQGEFAGTFGRLKDDSNLMVDTMKGLISNIKEAADAIGIAAREISAGNLDLSHRSEQQAANLEETAASVEELTSTVKQNSDYALRASKMATATSEVARNGGQIVSDVVSTMASITESSRRVEDIIAVIDGIAFQTNILALNAAVEAARAGEQGRGFSVVAAEVRALAQRSAGAAREIKQLIADAVSKANDGSTLVKQAGTTMGDVVTSVQSLATTLGEIAAASQEQTQGIEQINRAVVMIDDATQQNAARVEQAAAAAKMLSDQAESLLGAVSAFQLSDTVGPGPNVVAIGQGTARQQRFG